MSDALSIAAASMLDDMQRMTALSNNLANATTPGFRRELFVAPAYGREALAGAGFDSQLAGAGQPSMPQRVLDHRPGTLRATGHALDVALEEPGFFEVWSPQGPLYTRQGSFSLDAAGRLVDGNGWPVMGVGGEITLSNAQPRIDREGRILDGDRVAGQLKVVRFGEHRQLQQAGAGVYAAATPGEPVTARVRQAHLEGANVVTAHEMVHLIETMRHFEANQKVIHSHDEMLERAIRTLGEF